MQNGKSNKAVGNSRRTDAGCRRNLWIPNAMDSCGIDLGRRFWLPDGSPEL